jgi:hypothetical protein
MELTKRIEKRVKRKGFVKALIGIMAIIAASITPAHAQDYEIQQLLLDVEKLTQFKSILSDMEQGYTVLTQGYNQVKDLSQGNFNLHEVFLDGLMSVNPEVKKYARVADIIADEASIVSEYKSAFARFKSSGTFNVSELKYLSNVYGTLTAQTLQSLNNLTDVITSSKLRMSDDERLNAIDGIYADTCDKLQFLRNFNRRTSMLQLQRQKEQNDVQTLQKLYQQ